MGELRISEISKTSPDMSDADLANLAEDIRVHGQLVPIWIRDGEIIDGRKRHIVCQKLGIEPKTIDFSPDQDPEALAYSLNILRTHYTPSQRAMVGGKRATATHKDAGLLRHPAGLNLTSVGKTREQAAKETGVSVSAVRAAKLILKSAAPEVVAAVEAGKLTLHSAEEIIRTKPKSEQAQAVKSSVNGRRAIDGSRRMPKRDIAKCVETGLDQLENVIGTIEELFSSRNGDDGTMPGAWMKRLEKLRTRVSRLIEMTRKEKG